MRVAAIKIIAWLLGVKVHKFYTGICFDPETVQHIRYKETQMEIEMLQVHQRWTREDYRSQAANRTPKLDARRNILRQVENFVTWEEWTEHDMFNLKGTLYVGFDPKERK